MAKKNDKFISALRIVVQAEFGVELSQDDAVILANTLTDFFEALSLMKHRKNCPKKDELEKYIKQRWGEKRKINMTINHHDNHN